MFVVLTYSWFNNHSHVTVGGSCCLTAEHHLMLLCIHSMAHHQQSPASWLASWLDATDFAAGVHVCCAEKNSASVPS
jgi:hypothetical protein